MKNILSSFLKSLLFALSVVLSMPNFAQVDYTPGDGTETSNYDYDVELPDSFDTLLCLTEVSEGDSIFIPFVNQGAVTLNSFNYSYLNNGQLSGSFYWSGSVEKNGSGELVIPPFTNAAPGQIVLTLFTESPNGQPDQNTSNDTSIVTITIGEVPHLPFTSIQTDICINDTLTLGSSLPLGYNFYWSSLNDSTRLQRVNNSGVYSVNAYSSDGCSAEAVYNVHHLPAPNPQLTAVDSFCTNESPKISVSGKFKSYSWIGPGNVENDSIFVPNQSGNISLSVVDSNNCNFTFDTSIHVRDAPGVMFPNAVEYCEGDFAFIQPAISDDNTALDFLWSDGNLSSNRMLGTPGRYTVSISNDFGCRKVDTVDVTLNPLPQMSIVGPTRFCAGGEVAVAPDKIFSDYRWSNGSRNRTLVVDEGGIFTLTITDENNCSNSTSIEIEEIRPRFSLSGDTVLCSCDVLIIDLENKGEVFLWNDGSERAKRLITKEGFYLVNVTDGLCNFTDSLIISSIDKPEVDFEFKVDNFEVDFTNLSLDADSFLWIFEPHEYSNDTNPVYQFAEVGEYNVVLKAYNLCGSSATDKDISVGSISVLDHQQAGGVTVFPNPVSSKGVLNLNLESVPSNKIELRIYNNLGQMMHHDFINSSNSSLQTRINISQLAAGTYFLQVHDPANHSVIDTKQFVIIK